MSNKNLEVLLTQYAEKRRRNEIKQENRIAKIYKENLRLEEIDREIENIAIEKTKAILFNKQDINSLEEKVKILKKEKVEIIKMNNLDLSMKYDCDFCKDTGYIQKENEKTVMCNCLKQNLLNMSYNISNLSDIKHENFDNFNCNLFSDEVNEIKYKMKCSPRENIVTIKNACLKFIENFNNLETKNLFFLGNTGLGKTYMSNCVANELLKKGKTVLYQTAPVLLEKIIDNKFNKYKLQNADEFYNSILTVDLLIIDDLGAEYLNSMKVSELFTILNTRILNLNNKPTKTIISTNLNLGQIFKVYEERIGSRIAGYYDIYQFFGEDLRLKK